MGVMAGPAAGKDLPHGQKRHADDDLKNDQRLSKRFNLLNLEQNGKLYVPVSAPLSTPPAASYSPSTESMLLDDTPNRVYIHNLDAELDNIEQEEEKLVFLPDIEKKLRNIPKSVLVGDSHPSTVGKQMVLYGVPESLSLPKEKDSVRKAIIESRARAREKQVKDAAHDTTALSNGKLEQPTNEDKKITSSLEPLQEIHAEDEDAMDLG